MKTRTQQPVNSKVHRNYVSMGNEAIRKGDLQTCLHWYTLGLKQARELGNQEKIAEISRLIFTLL